MGKLFSRIYANEKQVDNINESTQSCNSPKKNTVTSPKLKPDKNSPKIYPSTENSHILTQFIFNCSLYDNEETPSNLHNNI